MRFFIKKAVTFHFSLYLCRRYSEEMKLLYYFIYSVLYLFSLLPMRVHYMISDGFYLLIYYVIGYRRKVVRSNLTSSFPEKSAEEIRQIERGFYHWFCDYLVESVKMLSISEANIRRRMVFKNVELMNECLERGQSCVFYVGHYGSWEWIASWTLWLSPKAVVAQIYHPIENKAFDRLFLDVRQRFGSVSIPMQETLRKMLEYRNAGKATVVGFVADQKPMWVNIHHWVDFLNHDTPVLTGTERIAKKLGTAVFYGDMRRIRRGYYETTVQLMTDNPKSVPDYGITDIYYRLLETTIRREPAMWLWSHNRWSRTREEFDARFEVVDGKVIAKKDS